ncbi:MAG: HAMP domain-containing histidine kinase [Bacillus sp. (in: Bacteria)]|nr:HAMP domain-containing histidine kinase [Bacillus sp. (in: firmicutes)]MCM1427301.1 HAMP domain-containing histidine kinase [Eubacterium sp.]
MAVLKKADKKEKNLSAFFLHFLLQVILAVILTGILWLTLLLGGIKSRLILPANYVEQKARVFADSLTSEDIITPDKIPDGADYAIYDKDGLLCNTNLSGSYLEKAESAATAGQDYYLADISGRVYLKLETDSQILILTYRIRSVFANPVLRRIFPDIETIGLIAFFLLLVGNLILVITRNARRLAKELLILQNATDQIREQNLDFEIAKTGVREFNQVADSLNALRIELSRSLEEQWSMQQQKKRQLSALAHDIKTPLTVVRGNAELLAETGLDAEQTAYNQFILKNAEQIQDYVSKIIETVREETFADAPSVSFGQFLDELCENTKSLGYQKELSVLFTTETLPETLPFPETSIKRILNNLLDNAVYYSPCHGTVRLHACLIIPDNSVSENFDADTMLQFTISDEGRGFSAQALRFGTEEFWQDDTSRGNHSRFGMGLTIVKQLVYGMGGTLTLGNRTDGGAVVTVKLPIKQ